VPYRQPHVEPPSYLRCPRCKSSLRKQAVGPNQVERCPSCHGVWIAAAEFNELIGDIDRREAVRASEPPHRHSEAQVNYLACPRCDELMDRVNFGRTSGILVDTCKKHGIWLDRGELRRVVDHLAQRAPESPESLDGTRGARERPRPPAPPVPDPELVRERTLLDVLIDILTTPFT
jgi:Zn-finger nucleic acid-binding protein